MKAFINCGLQVTRMWGGEARGSQQAQLSVNMTQLPVQIMGFVALLLNSLHTCPRMHTSTGYAYVNAVVFVYLYTEGSS